ncbi:MAG: bifunctional histidinol-phosphatase/imidazoleglycerol-phosphate dehydratase HisB [Thermoflavifilum sp.]|uniref:bifunctional histidinol-phosphatase/imidazoleglycerol-phosphate dehydratase HisB n=1 Tax=Thermoflavifilum sp. TaxID=1968839 RepID=UPI0018A3E430|nr:bifunctional histidinol-phosphatase/imidazoleglycerol-phosphate dehydratase HisB [Thermoflavifilum sp.]QOR76157.1 MAG: bifunctional histidinol-phosphatase/imidazoleglycerol-phosphate dehydratase HisB [Thermoflavifilum sp.]
MQPRLLFIDRDGTLIQEPPDHQIDDFSKLSFVPGMLQYLPRIARELDFLLVMVTNQDGLGTDRFPEERFWPIQHFLIRTLENEGVHFTDILIDRSLPEQKLPTRKPGTGMVTKYLESGKYDLKHSFVIGDRITDVQFAHNMGCQAIWLNRGDELGAGELSSVEREKLAQGVALETTSWKKIYEWLKLGQRTAERQRITNETDVYVRLNLDGSGKADIATGLGFFDHMLHQLARHGGIDLTVHVRGDLHVDEHHTIEDTAIALGEAIYEALGNKLGIERYGFCLPMDDALAQVAVDLGGRSWLVWQVTFHREKIGDVPTEMFMHFFKSLSDAARCNVHIQASGENEHHKIEAIFKAFAKALKMAVRRDADQPQLPTTKGVL